MGRALSFEVVVPAGATGVEVVFAPTRTLIDGIDVSGLDAVVLPGDLGPAFTLEFAPPAEEVSVTITVIWTGEAPRGASYRWFAPPGQILVMGDGGRVADGPTSEARYRGIYDARQGRSKRRAGSYHAFMWEIERQCNPVFWKRAGLTAAQIRERTAASIRMRATLGRRLEARWRGGDVPAGEAADRTAAAVFSSIFRKAAHCTFGRHPIRAALALEHFAAGKLRFEFDNPEAPGRMEVESEPDSYFIFYFAELGLLVRELGLDPDLWTDRMLRSLVKMQPLYIYRWFIVGGPLQSDQWCLVNYNGDAVPSPSKHYKTRQTYRDVCAGLDRLYDALPGSSAEFERLMHANLRLASPRCFDPEERP